MIIIITDVADVGIFIAVPTIIVVVFTAQGLWWYKGVCFRKFIWQYVLYFPKLFLALYAHWIVLVSSVYL